MQTFNKKINPNYPRPNKITFFKLSCWGSVFRSCKKRAASSEDLQQEINQVSPDLHPDFLLSLDTSFFNTQFTSARPPVFLHEMAFLRYGAMYILRNMKYESQFDRSSVSTEYLHILLFIWLIQESQWAKAFFNAIIPFLIIPYTLRLDCCRL